MRDAKAQNDRDTNPAHHDLSFQAAGESRDLRLMSHALKTTPAAVTTWSHDVFGNAVAVASFMETAVTSDTFISGGVIELSTFLDRSGENISRSVDLRANEGVVVRQAT